MRPKSSPKTSILKKTARVVVQPPIASTSSNGKEKAREPTTITSKKRGKAKAEPTQNQNVHLPTSFKVIAGTPEESTSAVDSLKPSFCKGSIVRYPPFVLL